MPTEYASGPSVCLCFVCFAICLLIASPARCSPAEVVLIRSSGGVSAGEQHLKAATQFYGVDLKVITATGAGNGARAIAAATKRKETIAVAITAAAIVQVNAKLLMRALARKPGGTLPLLILGLKPSTSPALLKLWSGGNAVACGRTVSSPHVRYLFGRVSGVTGQLTNIEVPFPGQQAFYFAPASTDGAQTILSVSDGRQVFPVFIVNKANRQRVFLECGMPYQSQKALQANDRSIAGAFEELAPELIFLKYSAGARGWHTLHQYANLTIDDANLREPYGFLDYDGLLTEMEKHNFHTTIAFIPWNYDRTESQVVSLVRSHPQRFSICIHGDNHDHKEFTDYGSKPLTVQVEALRQALARMERFHALTGIPYDKVMVFPHSVAPEKTFEALKTYNYLATVNSQNIPMGSGAPPGPLFALRPVTLSFADFPSIMRYSAAVPIPTWLIAINEFLDNPLFFYCHHDLFEHGMNAFDQVADRVNRLDPETRWQGLGDIVRHLYLVRLRDDSNYDVLAFSRAIDLENTAHTDSVFYVTKRQFGQPDVAAVFINGHDASYYVRDGYLHFSVTIPARATCTITIKYQPPLSSPPVSIAKNSFRVYLLRMASDFRDNVVYKNALGRALISSYYNGRPKPAHLFEMAFALMLACACAGWSIRIFIQKRHPASRLRSNPRRSPAA
ncbi:MAG TPA: hypothetical protein VMI06_07010 [Terriglobia bacterium]|nr:hypothetical protein [Terriglobia bacterium]